MGSIDFSVPIKKGYNTRVKLRNVQPRDQVSILFPVPGSSLSAKFLGPHVVDKKLSDTDYLIRTPENDRLAFVMLIC